MIAISDSDIGWPRIFYRGGSDLLRPFSKHRLSCCPLCGCLFHQSNFTTISLNILQIDVRFIVWTKTNIEQGSLDLEIFIGDVNQELRAGRLEVSFDEAGIDFVFDEKIV